MKEGEVNCQTKFFKDSSQALSSAESKDTPRKDSILGDVLERIEDQLSTR